MCYQVKYSTTEKNGKVNAGTVGTLVCKYAGYIELRFKFGCYWIHKRYQEDKVKRLPSFTTNPPKG